METEKSILNSFNCKMPLLLLLAGSLCACAGKAGGEPPQHAPVVHSYKRAVITTEESPAPADHATIENTDPVWEWLGNLTPEQTMQIEKPGNFVLKLKPDGWFEFQTDCKRGQGMYETTGDHRIALAVVDLAPGTCPRDSRHEIFLNTLESAGSFRIAGDRLYLDMKREKKTMVFGRLMRP